MSACTTKEVDFDWQGHRGARGLMPENTVPAFLKALEYPVTTLELDVVISKDGQVIVSHEPWMSHEICSNPDGSPVLDSLEESLRVLEMDYATIKTYDCGKRGNAKFPEQVPQAAHKPSLRDMVSTIEDHIFKKDRQPIFYNIETKSRPSWYDTLVPQPSVFVDILLKEIEELGIEKRTCIQSFDPATLRLVHAQKPEMTTALLVYNQDGVVKNVDSLGYVPTIYSPYYMLLIDDEIEQAHDMGMQVIPWTVNDLPTMLDLMHKGVDGIITDYPNLIEEAEATKMK